MTETSLASSCLLIAIVTNLPWIPQRRNSRIKQKTARRRFSFRWWPGAESNRRHGDFQSPALPTELPGRKEALFKRRRRDKSSLPFAAAAGVLCQIQHRAQRTRRRTIFLAASPGEAFLCVLRASASSALTMEGRSSMNSVSLCLGFPGRRVSPWAGRSLRAWCCRRRRRISPSRLRASRGAWG